MSWPHMSFKPAKSRSLVLKRGKVTDKFRISLGEGQIPSATAKPVKSLGKLFNCSLKDTYSIEASSADLEGFLRGLSQVWVPW